MQGHDGAARCWGFGFVGLTPSCWLHRIPAARLCSGMGFLCPDVGGLIIRVCSLKLLPIFLRCTSLFVAVAMIFERPLFGRFREKLT